MTREPESTMIMNTREPCDQWVATDAGARYYSEVIAENTRVRRARRRMTVARRKNHEKYIRRAGGLTEDQLRRNWALYWLALSHSGVVDAIEEWATLENSGSDVWYSDFNNQPKEHP